MSTRWRAAGLHEGAGSVSSDAAERASARNSPFKRAVFFPNRREAGECRRSNHERLSACRSPASEATVTGAASLRRGGVEDILYIMATERRPGYDLIVGRWTEAAHLAAIANPAYAYLVGTDAAGGSAGFVILRDLDDPHSNVCLKRIAVEQPGRGFGSTLLRLALSWTFSETLAHRIWLEVVADNSRARHVYAAAGFVEEGLLRQAWLLPDGGRIDLILMSVLRADWLQQARLTAGSAPIEE